MKDIQVGQEDGDLRYKLAQILKGHWLTGSGCSHEGEGSNAASCWCGWTGDRVGSLGEAINTWISHVLEEMRPHLAEAITAWNTRTEPSQAGWQPIETAPLGATEVLLADAVDVVVGWKTSDGYFMDWRSDRLNFAPTHWMPRPTPPAGES